MRSNLFDQVTGRACGNGDLPGMQRHVSTLDAFSCQGAQGSEILRQSHRNNDLCQFARGFNTHQLDRSLRGRMDFGRTTDDAHCHWHFKGTHQVAIRVLAPGGE